MEDKFTLKDSGERQTFDTGAKRDIQTGKGRYDLLSPIVNKRLAIIMEKGAVKYDARNWEKGMPLSRFIDSAKRHLDQFIEGHRDEDHLAQAIWNLCALLHIEEMIHRGKLPASLNDLPNYLPKETMLGLPVVHEALTTEPIDVTVSPLKPSEAIRADIVKQIKEEYERLKRTQQIHKQKEAEEQAKKGIIWAKLPGVTIKTNPLGIQYDLMRPEQLLAIDKSMQLGNFEKMAEEALRDSFYTLNRKDRDCLLLERLKTNSTFAGKPIYTYHYEPVGELNKFDDGVIFDKHGGLIGYYVVVQKDEGK